MASSTICTRQLFISGFSQISPSNGKFGWNILGELVKRVEGLVNKLEISTRNVNCSAKSATNRFNRFPCPPFPYFYCLIDNFFISLNHRTFVVATHIYRYPGQKSLKNYNFEPLWKKAICTSFKYSTVYDLTKAELFMTICAYNPLNSDHTHLIPQIYAPVIFFLG